MILGFAKENDIPKKGPAHLGAIENDEKIIKKQKTTNELRLRYLSAYVYT